MGQERERARESDWVTNKDTEKERHSQTDRERYSKRGEWRGDYLVQPPPAHQLNLNYFPPQVVIMHEQCSKSSKHV